MTKMLIYLLLQNKFRAEPASDVKVVFFPQEITFQGEYKNFILSMNSYA